MHWTSVMQLLFNVLLYFSIPVVVQQIWLFVFQTNLTSLEALGKFIDPSQLTADLDGSLHYDHAVWIEMRCVSINCTVQHRPALWWWRSIQTIAARPEYKTGLQRYCSPRLFSTLLRHSSVPAEFNKIFSKLSLQFSAVFRRKNCPILPLIWVHGWLQNCYSATWYL